MALAKITGKIKKILKGADVIDDVSDAAKIAKAAGKLENAGYGKLLAKKAASKADEFADASKAGKRVANSLDEFPAQRMREQVADIFRKNGNDGGEEILRKYKGMVDETPNKSFNKWNKDTGKRAFDSHYKDHVLDRKEFMKSDGTPFTKAEYSDACQDAVKNADVKTVYQRDEWMKGGAKKTVNRYGFYDSKTNIFVATDDAGKIRTCFKPGNKSKYVLENSASNYNILQYAGT